MIGPWTRGHDGAPKSFRIGPDARRFNDIRRRNLMWTEYPHTIMLKV